MIKFINTVIASVFYTGFIKKGGGTVSALIVCLVFFFTDSMLAKIYLTFSFIVLGTAASHYLENIWEHDSPRIVIDEAAGMALALFLLPADIFAYTGAFLLFRLFDIFKWFPVNKSETVSGSTGVMLDDIVAGLISNIIIHSALWTVRIL
ncbi:MAG: phosphatidylglycerophosphatase A [candidate division WOR-3 bacterium]|nr:phosphatidylglycerophosphatase A [candidate division WOR-3 bacterium]